MAEGSATWKRVKFGEIAQCVNDRVDDPKTAGVERYVGLEHLDPESLSIHRWGTPDDVESTKLRFKPGDIIFGKRRAYQRKLAVADFEGICSAHAMVLRAKPDAVVPEFLPFFMKSDLFMERAIAISVGSLSPTINWKTLAAEQFALPAPEEQRRISEVLCAWNDVDAGLRAALRTHSVLREAVLRDEFAAIDRETDLQSACLPIVRGIDSPGPEIPNGTPYVRIAEMTGPQGILLRNLKRTAPAIADAHPDSRLEAGDIVVALRGVVGFPVRVPAEAAGANLSRGTARVSVLSAHNADYVFYALQSHRVRREVLRVCTGWKGEDLREITLGSLRELRIPLPDKYTQERLALALRDLDSAKDVIAQRLEQGSRVAANTLKAVLTDERHVY